MHSYLTLRGRGSDEFIVNKSRFIGYACPVESEEEALSFLKERAGSRVRVWKSGFLR